MRKFKLTFTCIALSLILACGIGGVLYASAGSRNDLAVRFFDKQTEVCLGETVMLADFKPVYPDKFDYAYYNVQSPDGTRFAPENDQFVAEKEGEYKAILYVVGKDDRTNVETYSINAVKSAKPIVAASPAIPAAFVEGFEYRVPEASFVDYNTAAPTSVDYTVKLIDVNGSESVLSDKFSPKTDIYGDTVMLVYAAKSTVTGETLELSYEVPVLKAVNIGNYGDRTYEFDKMFYAEGVGASALTEKGVEFSATGNFSVTYANLLDASFSFYLLSEDGMNNFGKIVVTAVDSVNPNEKLTVEIMPKATDTRLNVNSTGERTTSGTLFDYEFGFALLFDNESLMLRNGDLEDIVAVKTNEYGKTFNGFSSGFIKLTFSGENLTAQSKLIISQLNMQTMASDKNSDKISSFVRQTTELVVKHAYGENAVVPAAIAFDVVDPGVAATVTVTAHDGNIVRANDGTLLDEAPANKEYTFTANVIGEYTLLYTAEDVDGNLYDAGYYTIFVEDNVAPTLELVSYLKNRVNVGTTVKIPELKYSDDFTANENIITIITISFSYGSYKYVKSGDEFTFDLPGQYHVRYSALDEYFNVTTIEQIITVI